MERLLSIPVVWSENGGRARPGRLDLGDHGLTLSGGSRTEPERHELAFTDVAGFRITRQGAERVSGLPVLVVALRDKRSFSIAPLSPAGALHELAERLLALVGSSPEPDPAAA